MRTRPIDVVDRSVPAPARKGAGPRTDVATMKRLLELAASAAAEAGVDLETFMTAAMTAVLETQPALRDHLEQAQLVEDLARLRDRGKLGQA